jgi:outer membrane lipoprotein-sorting protein
MRIFSRNPALRWAVPLLTAVVLIVGGASVNLITASAQAGLQPRTAAQLLVDVQGAHLDGLSGTVVQRADLGIPDLPGVGGNGSSDLTSLVSGTHTLRVWISGPDKARLALLGTFGESDVIVNGKDMWTWSSRDKTATHRSLPPHSDRASGRLSTVGPPTTPEAAARAALKAIDPTTRVDTSGTAVVAGRRAYELVLQPRTSSSLIGQVRIAIDGKTHVPLRVQVLAKGSDTPSFEVAFTHFDPTRPDAAQFRFNPPPGTKVTDQVSKRGTMRTSRPSAMNGTPRASLGKSSPTVVGHGWGAVVVAKLPADAMGSAQVPGQLGHVMQSLQKVSGTWGSGRLLAGSLFSVLLTDDGRVAVGAVTPQTLYDAVAAK